MSGDHNKRLEIADDEIVPISLPSHNQAFSADGVKLHRLEESSLLSSPAPLSFLIVDLPDNEQKETKHQGEKKQNMMNEQDLDVECVLSHNSQLAYLNSETKIEATASTHKFEIGETNDDDYEGNYRHKNKAISSENNYYEEEDGDEMQSFLSSSSTWLPSQAQSWLFPSNTPRSVQLFRRENIMIPACYFCVGVVTGFIGPFVNVYPLDLGATEAQQATISTLTGLPATLKICFGFISDNLPLCGYRRKSYMALGWIICSLSLAAIVFYSDLSLEKNIEYNGNDDYGNATEVVVRIPPPDAPSIPFLSLMLFLSSMGLWIADVMGDSLVAEKAKLEPESTRGHLQSSCYICRFTGMMFSAPLSMMLYSTYGPKPIMLMSMTFPLLIMPLIYIFWEPRNLELKSTRNQCREIWTAVCNRAVWQPMGAVFIYGTLQVSNAAWKEYLKSVLNFTATQLNVLLLAGGLLAFLGIIAYKMYMITWRWRSIYYVTMSLNGFFSALQVLLIQGITFGFSPFLFALGDDALDDFVLGMQFLPVCIMMVHLCPNGSEGAAYAMFTTVCNAAGNLNAAISTMLLGIWDVRKETLMAGDLSGMTKLTILTTALQVSGIIFVQFLPNRKEDLDTIKEKPDSNSVLGGFIFLSVTFLSIIYSVFVGVMNIIHPGWSGES